MNWSESSSLVSSSGPSSPNAFSDLVSSRGINSEHLLSRDFEGVHYNREVPSNCSVASTFPQTPGLDQDLGSVGILLESGDDMEESQQMNFQNIYTPNETNPTTELSFSPQLVGGGDSGELTPVSVSSEFEYRHQQYSEGNSNQESSSGKTDMLCLRDPNFYEKLDEEIIKRKFDNNINRLGDGEEDEEEKTITTITMTQRESIVGFFSKTESEKEKTEK